MAVGAELTLEASGLTLARPGQPTLASGIDFTAGPGEVLAVMGPSGSGKSTLLDVLDGTLPPAAGSIRLEADDGRRLAPFDACRSIARVAQDLLLVGPSTLEQNVLLGRLPRYPWWRTLLGFPPADRAEARALLSRLGLDDLTWKAAASVSGGERQRTAVARALFAEPAVLLADEPTANLDGANARRVMELLAEHARQRPATVVVVVHDARLAEDHADRCLTLGEEA